MISYQEYKFNNVIGGFTSTWRVDINDQFNTSTQYGSVSTYSFQTSYFRQTSDSKFGFGFYQANGQYYLDQDGGSWRINEDIGGGGGGAGATGFRKKCDSFVPTTFTKRRVVNGPTYTEAGFVNQTYYATRYATSSGDNNYGGFTNKYRTFNTRGGVTFDYTSYAYAFNQTAGAGFGGCEYDEDVTGSRSESYDVRNGEDGATTSGTGAPQLSQNTVVNKIVNVYPNPCGSLIGWNNTNNSKTVRAGWLVDYNFQPEKVFLTRTTEITSTGQTAVKPTSGTESYYDTENFTLFLQKTTEGTVLSSLETKVESYSTKTIVTDWTSTDSTDWTSTGTSETTQYTTVPKGTTTYSVNQSGEAIQYNTTYRENETTDATTTVLSTATKETTVFGGTTDTTTAERTLVDGTATETTEADISTWVEGNSSRFIITETDVTFTPVFSDTAGFVPTCITFNTSDYSKKAFDIQNYDTSVTPYYTAVSTVFTDENPIVGFPDQGQILSSAIVYRMQNFEVMYTVKQHPPANVESYYAISNFFQGIPEKETTYINNFQAGTKFAVFVNSQNEQFTRNSFTGSTLRWTYTTSNFVEATLESQSQFLSASFEFSSLYLSQETTSYTGSRLYAVLTNKIDYIPIYWDSFGRTFVAGWKSYLNNTTVSSSSTYTYLGKKLYDSYIAGDGQGRTVKFTTRSRQNIYNFTTEIGDRAIDLRDIGDRPISLVKEITALYSGDLKAAGWYGFGAINKTEVLEELTPYLGMSSQFSGRKNNTPSEEDLLNLSYTNISSAPVNFSESGSLFFNGGCDVDLGEQNGTLSWYRQKEQEQLSLFGTSTKLLATYSDTYTTVNSNGDPTISASYTFGTYSLYMDSSYSREFDDLLMTVGTAGLYRPLVKETFTQDVFYNSDSYGGDCLGVLPNYLSYSYGKSSLDTGIAGNMYLYDITAPKNNNPLTLVVPRAEIVVSRYTAPNKFIKATVVNKDAWATFTIQDGFRRRIELRPLVRVYKRGAPEENLFFFGGNQREECNSYGAAEIIPYQLSLSLDGWNGPLVTACST